MEDAQTGLPPGRDAMCAQKETIDGRTLCVGQRLAVPSDLTVECLSRHGDSVTRISHSKVV
jgi:hypothetical protein